MITFRNGDVYEGELRKGEIHGFGTYRWSDNRVYVGDWDHGVRTGYGKCYYKDGGIYEGHIVNDKKHGSGLFLAIVLDNFISKRKCDYNVFKYSCIQK
jgi:hypothetical protein